MWNERAKRTRSLVVLLSAVAVLALGCGRAADRLRNIETATGLLDQMRGGKVSEDRYDKHVPELVALGNDVVPLLLRQVEVSDELLDGHNNAAYFRKRVALKVLAQLKDHRIVPGLKEIIDAGQQSHFLHQEVCILLENDPSEKMVDYVAALAKLREWPYVLIVGGAVPAETQAKLRKHFTDYVDENFDVLYKGNMHRAIGTLGRIDNADAYELLVRIVRTHQENPDLIYFRAPRANDNCSDAVRALGKLQNVDPCPALVEALEKRPRDGGLIRAVGEQQCTAAISILEKTIHDTDPADMAGSGGCFTSAAALCSMGKDYETNAAIVRAALDRDFAAALEAARFLHDEKTIAQIASCIPKEEHRLEFLNLPVLTLGEIGSPSALPALRDALAYLPITQFRCVAEAMRAIGEKNQDLAIFQESEEIRAVSDVVNYLAHEHCSGPPSGHAERRAAAAQWLVDHPDVRDNAIRQLVGLPGDREWRSLLPFIDRIWDKSFIPYLELVLQINEELVDHHTDHGVVTHYRIRSAAAELLTKKTGVQYTFVDFDGAVRRGGYWPE